MSRLIDETRQLIKRFRFAGEGIATAIQSERNLQIQMGVTIVIIPVSIIIHVDFISMIIIIMLCGIVLSLELINTAIEHVVDLVTETYHPLAKKAKDISAGAVLLFSAFSVIIGLLIIIRTLFFE